MAFVNNTSAQQPDYCEALRRELNEALDAVDLWDIQYRYYKLLNTFGVSDDEKAAVDEAFSKMHWSIDWRANHSFQITGMPEPGIDWTDYFDYYGFHGLPDSHEIKTTYDGLEDFLKAAGLEMQQLKKEPVMIQEHNVIEIALHDKQLVLRKEDLERLLVIESDAQVMGYGGAGLFIANHPDHTCEVYRVVHADTRPEVKKIIARPGQAKSFPVNNRKNLIVIVDERRDHGKSSLYDDDGKPISVDQDYIELSPTSRTIIFQKDGRHKLVDYDFNPLLDDAEYIFEVWKNGEPYYIVDDLDGKRHLYDLAGNVVLSGKDYKTIAINHTPYAIVRRGREFGVIDFLTQDVWVPFQAERIHQLCPGFMASSRNGVWTIFDERNRKVGNLKAQQLATLTDRGKAVIKAIDEHGKEGAYDLFGNELLPLKYDAIEFKELEGKLLVSSGQTQFETDLEGKKLN